MKYQVRRFAIFSLIITLLFMASCSTETTGTATSGADTDKATAAIKEFYAAYIAEMSKMPPNQGQVEALKQKHCTAHFLNVLKDAELEEDPFLNAQDVDETWAETLEVTAKADDLYSVCYVMGFDNSKHCVEVAAVDADGQWKIDNVKY